jgi:hypothetical protein
MTFKTLNFEFIDFSFKNSKFNNIVGFNFTKPLMIKAFLMIPNKWKGVLVIWEISTW